MRQSTRRDALRTGGIVLLGSLPGCSGLTTDGAPADLSFEQLDVTAVYVADGVEVSMPSEIPTVENAHNAELLILPDDTDIGADLVVEWVADDRVLAVVGADAETTWLSWARSDEFGDTFENEGYGDSDPDPSLVVATRIGLHVKTYRRSWSDGPRNRDILRALDETLVAIENETPPG